MKMPYDDNVFDVALNVFVITVLQLEAFISHFKEMHRILVPGGKAVMVTITRSVYEKMFMRPGTDQAMTEKKIEKKLMNLGSYPSQDEINDAFQDLTDVQCFNLTLNQNGRLERITDADKMTNGQAAWGITQVMTFTSYFYSEQFIQQQIKAVGLNIDNTENLCTEERKIAYNSSNPEIKFDKTITDDPPVVMYHLSKPLNN